MNMINIFAVLLVVTSFFVMITPKVRTASIWYSVQSAVLVVLFLIIAANYGAGELFAWAGTAVVSKVLLLPALLYFYLGTLNDDKLDAQKNVLSPLWLGLIVVAILVVSVFVMAPVNIPMIADLKTVLAVSLAHFFVGLLCIVSQRNILKQVFGYCLMENGSSLTLALLAHDAPHLLEIGITVDAIFAVIVMIVLARLIYQKIGTLDVIQLNNLKG